MKKMNKKGFTLVELLVVLVLLAVIMSIAIPSVTSSMERSKQKQKDAKIELIVSAAEIYFDRNKEKCVNGTGDCYVTVKELVCDYRLLTKEQVKDPFNESSTVIGSVTYESDGNYSFSSSGEGIGMTTNCN